MTETTNTPEEPKLAVSDDWASRAETIGNEALETVESEGKKLWAAAKALFWKGVAKVRGWSLTRKILVGCIAVLAVLHFVPSSRQQAMGFMPAMPMWASMGDVDDRVELAKPEILAEVGRDFPSKADFAVLQEQVKTLETERASIETRLKKLESQQPARKRRR